MNLHSGCTLALCLEGHRFKPGLERKTKLGIEKKFWVYKGAEAKALVS